MSNILTIGLPKGSLQDSTLELFAKAGYRFYGSERLLWLSSNDPELRPVLLRPQEIPLYVANGSLDCGLAGWDWIVENTCEDRVRVLAELCYSKRSFNPVRWVLAVAKDSTINEVRDLKNVNPPILISTELRGVTEKWLAEHGILANVSFSWGATEAKVPEFADAIVEATETGSSLRANGLRIVDTVIESTTRFFVNNERYKKDEWMRSKVDGIALLLRSCLAAEYRVSLHFRVPKEQAETCLALLPQEAACSTWESTDGHIIAEVILDREDSRDLVPSLARNGAYRISLASLGMLHV